MKIGIFGSSFNPIHIGHLIISEQARYRKNLDKILLIPTFNPYHKNVDIIDYNDRFLMTEMIAKDNKYFEVSNIEENIEGNSYSYDVVKSLKEIYPNDDFYFITGSDSFMQMDTWYKYKDFLGMVNLIVFKRPGYEISNEKLDEYKKLALEITYYEDLQLEISSTYIRNSIKNGYIPKYLLMESTISYIEEKNLWK